MEVNFQTSKKQLQLESEDSSYDSDCEALEDSAHYNVISRTVSNTLEQEFDEYVTTNGTIAEPLYSLASAIEQSLSIDDLLYQSRIDFARRLGYSNHQVKIALNKLGPSASQNELLGELIQLDCSRAATSTLTQLCHKSQVTLPVPQTKIRQIILRHVVIDGSNIAMCHGSNKIFSCKGIQLAVEYFQKRGHKAITVFVPSYRKDVSKPDDPISDQELLLDLEKNGHLVFTPSRTIGNRRLVCYDDRYILRLAADTDGIVVSNDNYRDLTIESPEFKHVIQERMLMYSFVSDRFMPPEDPLGRNGPTLDQFLSKTPLKSAPQCPYGRKCTYGAKCKYFHPIILESVSENLRKQAALKVTQSLPFYTPKQLPITRTRSAVPLKNSGMNHPNTHKKLDRQLSINGTEDPRISFTSCNSTYLSPFPTQPGLGEVWSPPPTNLPDDEEKKTMFFHLAAIFPTHQVNHVMNLYPHEKDPQVICRHIIKLFSKDSLS